MIDDTLLHRFLSTAVLILAGQFATEVSAEPAIVWTRQLGSGIQNDIWQIAPDGQGGVIASGGTWGDLFGPKVNSRTDAFLVRYDSAGNLAWGIQNERWDARGLAWDGSQGFYVTGDPYVEKYSMLGELLWSYEFDAPPSGDPMNDLGTGVSVDRDGNVGVVGFRFGERQSGYSDADVFLRKFDTTGNLLWTQVRGENGEWAHEYPRGLAVDGNGNSVVLYAAGPQVSEPGLHLMKFDPDGSLLWTERIAEGSQSGTFDVDNSGNAFVAIGSVGLTKYDPDGNPIWTQPLPSSDEPGFLGLNDLAVDADGNVLVAGNTVGSLETPSVPYLGKYDSAGNLLWIHHFQPQSFSSVLVVDTDSFGNIFLGGGRSADAWFSLLRDVPPGDTNADGVVDLEDLNNVRNHFGEAGESVLGDTNSDGLVDLEDLNAVRNNFGAGESNAVPEPGTCLLIIVAIGCALTHRIANMRRCLASIALCASLALAQSSAGQTLEWVERVNDSNLVFPGEVAADGAGGAFVQGYMRDNAQEGNFVNFLAHFNEHGEQLWLRPYGIGNASQSRGSVVVTASGEVFVTGQENTGGLYLAKFSNDGVVEWHRQYGQDGLGGGRGISIDPLGNVVVGGGRPTGWCIFTFDRDGMLQSAHPIEPTHNISGLSTDALGNVIVMESGINSEGNYDFYVAKYDTGGGQVWTQQFGTDELDSATDLAIDRMGNVYITGNTWGSLAAPVFGQQDALLIKLAPDGSLVWMQQTGEEFGDWESGLGVATDSSGNVYLSGQGDGNIRGAFVRSFDPNGVPLWTGTLGPEYHHGVVAIDQFDNILLAGEANRGEDFRGEGFLAKFTLPPADTPGDTNADGVVDLEDLNNVRNHFGGTGLGDTNGDDLVDLIDLNNVRNHFGESVPAADAVPEPASRVLALACLSALIAVHGHNRARRRVQAPNSWLLLRPRLPPLASRDVLRA